MWVNRSGSYVSISVSTSDVALTPKHEEKMSRDFVDEVSSKMVEDDYFAQCFSKHYFLHELPLLC